jgi:hypothetical protein
MMPAAQAANELAPLTYKVFEESVPHIDLDTCPKSLANDKRFCRLTMSNDALHVFVFSTEGEQPLVAFKSYTQSQFDIRLKD